MQSRIASAVRFIVAFRALRLAVAEGLIEKAWGQYAIDILESMYPATQTTDPIDLSPYEIGKMFLGIARKQHDMGRSGADADEEARDSVQEAIASWTKAGTDFRVSKKGGKVANTWRQALGHMRHNISRKAMQRNMSGGRLKKLSDEKMYAHLLWKKDVIENQGGLPDGPGRGKAPLKLTDLDKRLLKSLPAALKKAGYDDEDIAAIQPEETKARSLLHKSIDAEFGTRPEGGGAPDGGEANLPTPSDSWLGRTIEDNVDAMKFFNSIDGIIPKIRGGLSPRSRALFDAIFFGEAVTDENVGTFLNMNLVDEDDADDDDILSGPKKKKKKKPNQDSNMNSIRGVTDALRANGDPDSLALLDKLSGSRGGKALPEVREKLLKEMQKIVEKDLTPEEFGVMYDEFFSNIDPDRATKKQLDVLMKKYLGQRKRNMRSRHQMFQDRKSGKPVSPAEEKNFENLLSRMELQDKAGGLKYIATLRNLTPEETRELKSVERQMKDRDMNFGIIPPIPFPGQDVETLEAYANMRWLEKNTELTDEQSEMMDDLIDQLMRDGLPKDIIKTVKPVKSKSGTAVASIITIAARIAFPGAPSGGRRLLYADW